MGKQVTIEIVDGKLIYDLVPGDSLVRTPKARKPSKPVQLEKRVSEEPAALPTRSTLQSVYVDGSINHSRYLVRINGVDVLLRGKSFLYFTVLAVNRTRGGGGWTHKADVEAGENQIKYFY